jgi:replicative DNA helicase
MANTDDKLKGSLQQNVLAWLLFSDKYGPIVRNTLDQEHWSGDSAYLRFLGSVYTYYDNFKVPPKAHTNNLIDELTITFDQKELLNSLVNLCQEKLQDLNEEYVMKSLSQFFLRATGKQRALKCLELYSKGTEEADAEAYEIENSKKNTQLKLFNPGTTILERINTLITAGPEVEADKVKFGIPALDDLDLVPQRKQLYLFGGLYNAGKSFFLTFAGQKAIESGKKVLHITLELSQELVADRYICAFFKYSNRALDSGTRTIIKNDEYDLTMVNTNKVLTDADVLAEALDKIEENPLVDSNLMIKEFPTSGISLVELEAFIDQLEDRTGFSPDMIVIDYADLIHMKGSKKTRTDEDLTELYRKLRGIAVERNIMMVTATQLNREAAKINKETGKPEDTSGYMVAGAFSKMFECDIGILYAQTELERDWNMARLIVDKARSASKPTVYITQDYSRAQFVTGSMIKDKINQEKFNVQWTKMKSDQG